MKKIYTCLLALLIPYFLISCGTTSTAAPVAEDAYDAPIKNETSSEEKSSETKQEKKDAKQNTSWFTYGNKGEYETVAPSTLFAKNSFGVMGQKDASVVFRYKDKTAGIGSSYQGLYYFSLFDKDNRTKLIKAYNQYLSDFDNKKLDRKGNKTFKAYGNGTVMLRWGTLSNSTPNFGDGTVSFGYEFEGGSPYFTITVYPVYNDYYDVVGEAVRRESLFYKVFFTKAQAKQFLDNISNEALSSYIDEAVIMETKTEEEKDEY